MTERLDPFAILQALRPATDDRRVAVGELPHADALLVQVLERGPRPAAGRALGRSRRRWVVAASVVTGSLVAASAAAAILWQSRSDERQVLACYAAAASDADRFEIRIDAGDDPIAACSVLWTDGTFATGGQPASRECVTDDGTTAVVPGAESACEQAGLQPIDASDDGGTPDDATAVDRLTARLTETFLDECLDESTSRTEADLALRDEGLDAWSVVISVPFSTDRPCGTASVSAAERTIVIAAVPSEPGGGG